MVTNLPPEALAQFRKVVASRTPEEKLQNLKLYLSMIPKHKGTAKLVVQVKRQISRLEDEIAQEKARKRRQRSSSIMPEITKSKSTVVLLTVSENISKCFHFIKSFTGVSEVNARHDTYKPFDIRSYKFGGVELIFLMFDFSSISRSEMLDAARKSDVTVLLADTMEELSEGLNVLSKLGFYNLFFVNSKSKVIVEEHGYGISTIGKSKFLTESQIEAIVIGAYKYKGAKVYLSELSTSYALRAALERGASIKPLMVVSTTDLEDIILDDHFSEIGIVPSVFKLDVTNDDWKETFLESVLRNIGKIRVFTKPPSGDVDQEAILIRENGTVEDLANFIHRDLIKSFKYARVRRKSSGSWIKVGTAFELKDGDILEIRAL